LHHGLPVGGKLLSKAFLLTGQKRYTIFTVLHPDEIPSDDQTDLSIKDPDTD
jgi:hypothetical protein